MIRFFAITPLFLLWISLPSVAQEIPPIPDSQLDVDVLNEDSSLPELNQLYSPPVPSGINPDSQNRIIKIGVIEFEGNTVFLNSEIQEIIQPFIGKTLAISELRRLESTISKLYEEASYIGSGAYIASINQVAEQSDVTVTLKIIEQILDDVQINGAGRLTPFVRKNISRFLKKPFNEKRFLNELRFLINKDSIKTVRASIIPTEFINETRIQLDVEPGRIIDVISLLNNARSPSIGEFERGVSITHRNLSGIGDQLQINYRNTDGSNLADLAYRVPINSRDGSIALRYLFSNSKVVEAPLNQFDLESQIHQLSLEYRQPIIQRSNDSSIQELAVGAGIERYDSSESLNDIPLPLSQGSTLDGKTRSTIFGLFQEFSYQTRKDRINARSDFLFGLPIGSTNDPSFGNGEFFKVELNGEYTHDFSDRISYSTRFGGQYSSRTLISNEQFFLGGTRTVRGFSPNGINQDIGGYAAQELRFLLLNQPSHQIELAPFFDFGLVSNNSLQAFVNAKTIAASGLVLRVRYSDRLLATLEYAQPILGSNNNNRGSDFIFSIVGRIF